MRLELIILMTFVSIICGDTFFSSDSRISALQKNSNIGYEHKNVG